MATSAHSQQQEEASLLRSDADGVAKLTLNRPRAGNSLSRGLMAALQAELDDISADADVRVVVIAATGEIFCAGHDLKEIRANPGRAAYEALFGQCAALMTSIVKLPQPVIARVQGVATAAGCQLVASCDLAIAGANARFCTPGVHIGLFCSTPMVALSRNVSRKAAMEMLLTGEEIAPETAEKFGLINRAVSDAELDPVVDDMCARIVDKSPLTVRIGKQAFYRQLEMGLEDAYDYASQVMTENMLTKDAEEGIDAFLQKRSPVWRGK
ncbi:MAG TPA: enoyl-CoA hydratase [Alphaproteobacteria bacterium]|nr:enoyl-CoA hydratase [Alphaproteobacteria bacterium]